MWYTAACIQSLTCLQAQELPSSSQDSSFQIAFVVAYGFSLRVALRQYGCTVTCACQSSVHASGESQPIPAHQENLHINTSSSFLSILARRAISPCRHIQGGHKVCIRHMLTSGPPVSSNINAFQGCYAEIGRQGSLIIPAECSDLRGNSLIFVLRPTTARAPRTLNP